MNKYIGVRINEVELTKAVLKMRKEKKNPMLTTSAVIQELVKKYGEDK